MARKDEDAVIAAQRRAARTGRSFFPAATDRFTGILQPSPTGSYYNPARYANQAFSQPEINRIQRNLANVYSQDLQFNRVANPNYVVPQDTGVTSTAAFGSGRASPATTRNYINQFGTAQGNNISFQTPSGGSISFRPRGGTANYLNTNPFGQGVPSGGAQPYLATSFGKSTQDASQIGNQGFVNLPAPTQQSPYQRSYALGFQGSGVQRPESPGIGYQVGALAGNALRGLGRQVAGFFGGGTPNVIPSANAGQPSPTPTPFKTADGRSDLLRDTEGTFYGGGQVPIPTATPTPYAPPRLAYNEPRKYSDYY